MKVSFIGAQGTGKTTTLERVVSKLSGTYHIVPDQYRLLSRDLGYDKPRSVVLEAGESQRSQSMSAFVSSSIASFSQMSVSNCQFTFADLDPISYYAFYEYWIHRAAQEQNCKPVVLPSIKKLAKHYSDMFDINFYFPVNAIPLKSDDMRAYDLAFQFEVDRIIRSCIEAFKPKNLVRIESTTVEERCEEVLSYLK
ncbi:AAA family ATPase [Vibrio marisflavi]|uniref:NadR/Ttd14 AAA domain-containing protein n=1 Tax=Vibrio marisflavi CECT 7928 TaxID=634439 RepID=A0ABN8E932_9VIBR|nr:AAA family ATPase [Vibrio marisflavi]CAH0539791.1 hypothetical protein VMF7928_02448 [Vibrio marisflavi CECT 7928]